MDIFNEIINKVHALKKRHNCVGGGELTTRPPGELSPNQAQAASPMVCGWRLCAWFGCRRAIGDGRGQGRRPPWCAGNEFRVLKPALKNSLLQHVGVWYSSTYVEEKKGRFRTRVKLVRFWEVALALGPVHRQKFFIPHTPFLYKTWYSRRTFMLFFLSKRFVVGDCQNWSKISTAEI